jgi:hypothetical protein
MPNRLVPSQVFCHRRDTFGAEEWYCIVEGRQYGPWRSEGEAKAGLQVEQNRYNRRKEKANAPVHTK